MSTSPDPERVTLTVTAKDAVTELFLIDAKMQLVARGKGRIQTEQPPGVYKVKLRAGPSAREDLVVLRNQPVHHEIDHLRFDSAAPLNETALSHEYQQAAALQLSREVHLSLGAGSSLFVFAREWTPGDPTSVTGHHPAEQLTLCSVSGEQVVDFQAASVSDLSRDPWSACRVVLAPGLYRLAVGAETGETFEMILPAIPAWHTQVFLLQRDNDQFGRGRRADLGRASVLLSASAEFRQQELDNRLAEIAKLALVDRRRVVSEELVRILDGKFTNPMLGIFGGHLLLLESEPRMELLRVVVSNLRGILGTSHPDVEALALACGLETAHIFEVPPMLRQSWRIVVLHSVSKPHLVPPGSLAATIATQITNQEPWLIWRRPDSSHAQKERLRGYREFLGHWLEPVAPRLLSSLPDHLDVAKIPGIEKLVHSLDVPTGTLVTLISDSLSSSALKSAAKRGAAKKALRDQLAEASGQQVVAGNEIEK